MKPTLVISLLVSLISALPASAAPKAKKAEPRVERAEPVGPKTAGVTVDDEARFLAGLPVTGPLAVLTQSAAWREHAASLDTAWARMEQRQLSRVRLWAHGVPSAKTLYYFFSGPDCLYATTIFPDVSTYVLCGIEAAGGVSDLPRLSDAALANSLGNLRQTLSSILRFHYFITKELRVDLVRNELGGAVPIMLVFLARTGHTVQSLEPFGSGAVKITFSGESGRKTLYYFATDVSNGADNATFFSFCLQQRPAVSLLKAASYLLHESNFSKCRDFLLQNSEAIVQDDSGIPYRAFPPDRWTVRLFGKYAGTSGTFAKFNQPDLLETYQRTTTAPLGFSFGYEWNSDRGTLMIATPR